MTIKHTPFFICSTTLHFILLYLRYGISIGELYVQLISCYIFIVLHRYIFHDVLGFPSTWLRRTYSTSPGMLRMTYKPNLDLYKRSTTYSVFILSVPVTEHVSTSPCFPGPNTVSSSLIPYLQSPSDPSVPRKQNVLQVRNKRYVTPR